MQASWLWSKIETCRSEIYMYFNVNFRVFFKLKSALVGEWTLHISKCTVQQWNKSRISSLPKINSLSGARNRDVLQRNPRTKDKSHHKFIPSRLTPSTHTTTEWLTPWPVTSNPKQNTVTETSSRVSTVSSNLTALFVSWTTHPMPSMVSTPLSRSTATRSTQHPQWPTSAMPTANKLLSWEATYTLTTANHKTKNTPTVARFYNNQSLTHHNFIIHYFYNLNVLYSAIFCAQLKASFLYLVIFFISRFLHSHCDPYWFTR